MSALQRFAFDGLSIDIQRDESGDAWFSANDVCNALGHSNSRKAIADHVADGDVTKRDAIDSLGRSQKNNYINESGVYSLILGSKLESAKRFKHWLTSDVLPSIRKTGSYTAPAAKAKLESDAANDRARAQLLKAKESMLKLAMASIDSMPGVGVDARQAAKASLIERYADIPAKLLLPETTLDWMTPTEIGKKLGKSAHAVGRAISALNIRGNVDGYSRGVLNKAPNSDKTIVTHQYTSRAVDEIAAYFAEQPVGVDSDN